jgi:hypothetical protein
MTPMYETILVSKQFEQAGRFVDLWLCGCRPWIKWDAPKDGVLNFFASEYINFHAGDHYETKYTRKVCIPHTQLCLLRSQPPHWLNSWLSAMLQSVVAQSSSRLPVMLSVHASKQNVEPLGNFKKWFSRLFCGCWLARQVWVKFSPAALGLSDKARDNLIKIVGRRFNK